MGCAVEKAVLVNDATQGNGRGGCLFTVSTLPTVARTQDSDSIVI